MTLPQQDAGRAAPRRVIVDTDPGVDDAVALWLALGAADRLAVEAVTVTGGNVGLARCLENARAVVGLSGRAVPVHAGADRPLLGTRADAAHVHGEDGLGAVTLPPGPAASAIGAADAIRALLRAARDAEPARTLTLVGLGPVTNLALALATEPDLAVAVDCLVLMSGAIGPGNITPFAEFNAAGDPEALAILLEAGPEVVFATLDLTGQALLTPSRLAALRAVAGGSCLEHATALLAALPAEQPGGAPVHDACAVAYLVAPSLFTTRRCRIEIVLHGAERGRTQVVAGPPNARLLDTIDGDGFFGLLARCVGSLP